MKKLLSVALVLSFSSSAFADQSILETRENGLLGVKLNSPVTFAMYPPVSPDKYYHLEQDAIWQNGVRVAKKDLVATAPFCAFQTTSFASMEKTADQTLPVGNLIMGSIHGRVSADNRFATIMNLDAPLQAVSSMDLTVDSFRCESAVGVLKETTVDEVKAITGGAVELVESLSFISDEIGTVVSQMILENQAGLALFKRYHKIGPVIEKAVVETLSESGGMHNHITVVKFTITSLDCLGTDACMGTVVWEVTATTHGDGYSWNTTYVNKVSKK